MNNPWKAKRINIDLEGYGQWQIYQRNTNDDGFDIGILIICDVNVYTQTDEIPPLVEKLLDAHNNHLIRTTVDEFQT